MIRKVAAFVAAVTIAALVPGSHAAALDAGISSFTFAEIPLDVVAPPVVPAAAVEPVVEPEVIAPATVPIAPLPPSLDQISLYILRTSSPQDLIRYFWRDTPHVQTMLRIADRESGFSCSADNPYSSAAGLFQTLAIHRKLAESLVVPGTNEHLTWSHITGPDCLDDVVLAWQLYDNGRGLRHWALTR